MKIAFVGAAGYGNVGDDTYPEVFAQRLPEHELVFYNSDLPACLPKDLDLLVIGGGGVLYNNPEEPLKEAESPHFQCMKFYLDEAEKMGLPWGILSCGFQFRPDQMADYETVLTPWKFYLEKAHFVTVRSPRCREIANKLGGRKDTHFYPDAAYLFTVAAEDEKTDFSCAPVTFVPAGAIHAECPIIQHQMKNLAASKIPTVWMGMGATVDDESHLAMAARLFPETTIITQPGPQEAKRRIAASRFVITGRYHGMVFARSARVPYMTALQTPYKLLQEDYQVPPSAAEGHFQVLRDFIRQQSG